METELRWILIGLSAVLLLGIWWWGARRSSQASRDARLREPTGQEREPPHGDARGESCGAPFVAAGERDWGVPPLEPLSIRDAPESLPLVEIPMSAHAEPYIEPFIVPRSDAPRTDVPPADATRADVPRADVARADVLRADMLRADVLRADTPRTDVPRADTPRTDAPRAGAPVRPVAQPFIADDAATTPQQAQPTRGIPAVSDAALEENQALHAESVRHAEIAKARVRFAPRPPRPPRPKSADLAAEAAYESSEQGAVTQPVPALSRTGHIAPAPESVAPELEAADVAERVAPASGANTVEKQKIVTMRVSARTDTRWSGEMLLRALEANGLAYGRYQVFHRRHVDGRSLFCVASLVEPGTFDIERMPQDEFRGVTLFAVLPGPVEPLLTVDELFSAAQGLAEDLAGVIQDAKGIPFSPQRIAAVRDDVARFQASMATLRE